jgi:tetratricopeptide (TPR) repeat protein
MDEPIRPLSGGAANRYDGQVDFPSRAPEAAVSRARTRLACLALLTLAVPCPAAAPPAGPLPAQVARWVEQLGDDAFAVREAATRKLRAAGAPAEAALEKAAAGGDPEVVRRAKGILADFRWGIYPDTPAAIVALIQRYQAVSGVEKRAVIEKLFAAGGPGCRALVKIARAEQDPLVRKEVFTSLAASMFRGVPALLETGDLAALEGLLQLAVEGDARANARHFAAYHLLTGRLGRRIAELEARARAHPPGKAEAEVLAYLYRARGDLAKAARAAADAELDGVLEGVLYEAGNWQELSHKPALTDMSVWTRYVGSRAAYARLAGREKLYEAAVKDLLARAGPVVDSRGDVMPFAKGLFLNARPREALELLKKADARPRLRFDVLAARLELPAAFAVVDAARKANSAELPGLEIAMARVLFLHGEKDRALAILKRYAGQIKAGPAPGWHRDLVDVELQLGRTDEAFAHAAKGLGVFENPEVAGLFEKLFVDQEEEAATLWYLSRRTHPKQPADKALAGVRALLEGKAGAAAVDALVKDAGVEPATPNAVKRAEEWLAAGAAARWCKQERQAAECYRKAKTARALIAWGDLLANKKQWPQAAGRYLEAYRLAVKAGPAADPREDAECLPALALYLHGRALTRAGRTGEGEKRVAQAHLLPLGSGSVRYYLARALERRGEREAAGREHELLRLLGEPVLTEADSFYTGEGLRAAAVEAAGRKQFARAADGYEQAFLRCLSPDLNFARSAAYVTVPAHIHRLRARGLAEAGKFDEAKREAQRAAAAMPGAVDVVLELAPLFDAKGRGKDADALFRPAFAVYEGLAKDYPRDAWAMNQGAWLSACCRRSLGRGLGLARQAVALAPDNAGYLDTLAEVLFQSGKKAEALVVQKKAVALQPARAYFRKQLRRIEKGDPAAARPEDDE